MFTRPFAGALFVICMAVACGPNVVVDSGSSSGTGASGTGASGTGACSGGGGVVACDVTQTAVHLCAEVASSGPEVQVLQQQCAMSGGTVVDACPTANLLGRCSLTQSGLSESEFFYSGSVITLALAEMACASAMGTWTPGC